MKSPEESHLYLNSKCEYSCHNLNGNLMSKQPILVTLFSKNESKSFSINSCLLLYLRIKPKSLHLPNF